MGEITAASQEQTSGIEQINQAITQMDQVTQQNAALVEEAAAAAGSLQEQASSLVQAVSVFKMASDGEAARVIAQAKSNAKAQQPARKPGTASALKRPAESAARNEPKLASSGDWTEF
jgi:methyl-accepting chemotaxis protein